MTTTNLERRAPARLLAGAGGLWGLALLTHPHRVVAGLCPEFPESHVWVVRVLGARLVAQHAALLLAPRATTWRAAVAIEGLHAASMVPLLGSPRYGRAARISGGVAAAWALLAGALAGRSERR